MPDWTGSAWVGPAIIAAVISALVTALGWAVGSGQEMRRARRRRAERVRDVQTAIRAEIRASLHRFEELDLNAHLHAIVAEITAESGHFTPFVPREAPNFVMSAIVGDIQVLPGDVIEPVVTYYRQIATIAQLAEDMRTERFDALPAERKARVYEDHILLMINAAELARQAIDLMGDKPNRVQ